MLRLEFFLFSFQLQGWACSGWESSKAEPEMAGPESLGHHQMEGWGLESLLSSCQGSARQKESQTSNQGAASWGASADGSLPGERRSLRCSCQWCVCLRGHSVLMLPWGGHSTN